MNGLHGVGEEVRLEARRRANGEILLVVEGTFDLSAALRVATAVRATAAEATVRIDLRRARIHDAALAALAREAGSRRVAIVGLSRHHERLLRYLDGAGGVSAAAGAEG
jgi:hypothetical protein